MNLGRFFAKGWIVALAIAPLAVAHHVNPQLSLERLVSPATASPAAAAALDVVVSPAKAAGPVAPVTYKKNDIVAVSSTAKLDSQASVSGFAPAKAPIPEPYAWIMALGFLAFLILRRTRGSAHAF